MIIARRAFLAGLVAAPLVAHADNLMKIRGAKLIVPGACEWRGVQFDSLDQCMDAMDSLAQCGQLANGTEVRHVDNRWHSAAETVRINDPVDYPDPLLRGYTLRLYPGDRIKLDFQRWWSHKCVSTPEELRLGHMKLDPQARDVAYRITAEKEWKAMGVTMAHRVLDETHVHVAMTSMTRDTVYSAMIEKQDEPWVAGMSMRGWDDRA